MTFAQDFALQLRSQSKATDSQTFERRVEDKKWKANETAVIVCDVWDAHHCLNAVRRMDEFLPTLNRVIEEARKRGATIIHSPSDCMEAYAKHSSRLRSMNTPVAPNRPAEIGNWCSRIPNEEAAVYPIDQSDGGEDDDPEEHKAWAEKLTAQGRNPKMPWKKQSDQIKIDPDKDFISDRGDEVWNILEGKGIQNVILVGVHTNMCVLGRPFGLRQMVLNGKRTCLMRDMTDCMYNPARYPFVDHFTGNDLIVSHIERFVCPTITSDQIVGGKPFRFAKDKRAVFDVQDVSAVYKSPIHSEWTLISLGSKPIKMDRPPMAKKMWYRCALLLDATAASMQPFSINVTASNAQAEIWIDGHTIKSGEPIPKDFYFTVDANWIVVCLDAGSADRFEIPVPNLTGMDGRQIDLVGNWEVRWDDAQKFDVPALPAKFGASPDILIAPQF